MCIIIGAAMPPAERLAQCAKRNPHGFGFATADRVYKTMQFSKFIRELQSIDEDEAAIIHFRYATHGSIKIANCHPFKDEDAGVSFAHNGIIGIMPSSDMTDSETAFRGIIAPVIQEYGLQSQELAQCVNEIIGASRFAFIDDKGQIRLFGNFISDHGCYYSNSGFMTLNEYMTAGL